MAEWTNVGEATATADKWQNVGGDGSARTAPVAPKAESEGSSPSWPLPASVADAALSLGSAAIAGPVSGLAGLASSMLPGEAGQGSRTVEKVQNALTYEPRSKIGKGVTAAVSYPFEKLAEGADAAGGWSAEKTGSPLIGAGVNTAIQALPMAIAPALKRAGPIKTAAERNPKQAANTAAAKEAGYRQTPEEASAGIVAKTAASLSGEPKLAKLISKKNQETHNSLIAEDLGLPKGAELDRPTLKKIRDDAGDAYEAVKTSGKVTTDAKYAADLDAIVKGFDTAAKDFSHRSENPFKKTLDGLKVGEFDAASAVEEVKLLRRDADKAYAARDPGLGRAYKSASIALDDMLDRHLQGKLNPNQPALMQQWAPTVKAYQEARARIAKSYAAEAALNEQTGNINAQSYARALEKNKPLTGGARTVGEFARTNPRSAQKPSTMPTGATIFDAALSGLSGEWKLALARPAVRSFLSSKLGQAFIGPSNWRATEMARQLQANPAVAAAETSQGQRAEER